MLEHALRRRVVLVETPFHDRPQVLDWVEIRRLGRPFEHTKGLFVQPFLDTFGLMLRVIVMLKDDLLSVQTVVIDGIQELCNRQVEIGGKWTQSARERVVVL